MAKAHSCPFDAWRRCQDLLQTFQSADVAIAGGRFLQAEQLRYLVVAQFVEMTKNQHFTVDGVHLFQGVGRLLGFETGEQFLSGVAACGVELIHVIARDQQVLLVSRRAEMPAVVAFFMRSNTGGTLLPPA